MPRGLRAGRARREHHHPLGPQHRPGPGADAVAAGHRGGAPPPRARGHAPQDRARGGDRRGARDPPPRLPDRLRQLGREPLHPVRVGLLAPPRRPPAGRHEPRGGRAAGGQGDRQGAPEGALEDGHLHDPLLHRRPDLRGRGHRARAGGPALHRHRRRGSAAWGSRCSRARRSTATRAPTRRPPPSCCRRPASTSGAAAACSTAGTRRRSRASSTPHATATAPRPTSASPAT